MTAVHAVKTLWDRWKITILFLAVFALAIFTHTVDVKHNEDTCNAVSQVRSAVHPLTTPTKLHGGEDAATVLRVKAANSVKSQARSLLDRGLACE